MFLTKNYLKRSVFSRLAIIFLLASCAQQNTAGNTDAHRMMTFNLRYGSADDGADSWQFRKDLLMQVIRDFNPHILGVQEALDFQIEAVKSNFPHYLAVGVGRDDGKNAGEFSAIFIDSTKYTVLENETFWFSEAPAVPGSMSWGANYPRICSWVKLKSSLNDNTFFVYNNHWDHQSQLSRENSARMLIQKIKSHTKPNNPVVVMGDFNAAKDNEAILILTQDPALNLKDSYSEVVTDSADSGTFNFFKGTISGPKIDNIFVSQDCITHTAQILRTQKNGHYPSDHYPVTAVISFK